MPGPALCLLVLWAVNAPRDEVLQPPKGAVFDFPQDALIFTAPDRLAVVTAKGVYERRPRGDWRRATPPPWTEVLFVTGAAVIARDERSLIELDPVRWQLRRRFDEKEVQVNRVFDVLPRGLLAGLWLEAPTVGVIAPQGPPVITSGIQQKGQGFRISRAALDAQDRLFFCSDEASSIGAMSLYARSFPDGKALSLPDELVGSCRRLWALGESVLVAHAKIVSSGDVVTAFVRLDKSLHVVWESEVPSSRYELSADGTVLVTLATGVDATLSAFSTADGKQLVTQRVGPAVATVAVAPDGSRAAVGYDSGVVRVWAL